MAALLTALVIARSTPMEHRLRRLEIPCLTQTARRPTELATQLLGLTEQRAQKLATQHSAIDA